MSEKQPRTRMRDWLNKLVREGSIVGPDTDGVYYHVDWVGSMSVQTRPKLPVEGPEGIEETAGDQSTSEAEGALRRRDEYGPTRNWNIRDFVVEFDVPVGHVCLRCKHEFDLTGEVPPDAEADCPVCDAEVSP